MLIRLPVLKDMHMRIHTVIPAQRLHQLLQLVLVCPVVSCQHNVTRQCCLV